MRIHHVPSRTVRGTTYTKTFLLIPKRLEGEMRLRAGSTRFLSALRPKSLLLARQRRYADDVPVTLSPYTHKRTAQQTYYNLRITIPKQFAARTCIDGFAECDIYRSAKNIAIQMQ